MSKSIVITGSTRGIGLEMALEFMKSGCNVTLSGRKQTMPEETAYVLSEYSEQCTYIQCDVQKTDALQNLWDKSVQSWGHIDIWINNAGQNSPSKIIWDTDSKYVENVIATNLTGMIFGSQIAAKNMLEQKYGSIYSMEGLGSNNMIQVKTILYGTTKHALTYFMKGLAKELEGSGVTAGRLSPGMMLTDFITKTPEGNPSDIVTNDEFKKVFNILADKPETVAAFLVPKILSNKKNDAHIMWLTNLKAAYRFISAPFHKRKLI